MKVPEEHSEYEEKESIDSENIKETVKRIGHIIGWRNFDLFEKEPDYHLWE